MQGESAAANPSAVGAPAIAPKTAPRSREDLILEHLAQVRIVASRLRERLPSHVGMEDLISAGILGLITAVDRYDKLQNVKLSTYAEYKIRGAMLDALREMDWAPRQQRRRARKMEQAIEKLKQTLQREPTEEEISALLGIPLAEYHSWTPSLNGLHFLSLESSFQNRSFDLPIQVEQKELAELKRTMSEAIEQMPAIEKTVLQMSYYEGLTLREIGQVMSLHESRISQLRTQALQRLRGFLAVNPESAPSNSGACDRASRKPQRNAKVERGHRARLQG